MKKIGKYVALALGATIILSGCTKNEQSVVTEDVAQEASTQEEIVQEDILDTTEDASNEEQTIGLLETSVSNNLFSITIPFDKSKFVTETNENGIFVYHKDSYDAGFGGFCFGISLYEKPSDYAGGMDEKIGEMMKDGETVYDVVMSFPSEVQWDYTKSEEMPEDYAALYNSAKDIAQSVIGNDGETFEYGKGCNGVDLYNDTLKMFVGALSEDFDEAKLEENNLSSQYLSVKDLSKEEKMESIKYAYRDVNGDGIDELLVGQNEDNRFVIYDLYTVVDRNIEHVLKSFNESKFYALEYFLVNEASDGEGVNYINVLDIEPNTTNFMPQVSFKYDTNTDTYGISYAGNDDYEEVTKEEYEERLNNFKNYASLDILPLSTME